MNSVLFFPKFRFSFFSKFRFFRLNFLEFHVLPFTRILPQNSVCNVYEYIVTLHKLNKIYQRLSPVLCC